MIQRQLGESLILVEGAFDRLTLLAAGFRATEVVALVGTAAQPSWFPKQVKTIILALDADEGGRMPCRDWPSVSSEQATT